MQKHFIMIRLDMRFRKSIQYVAIALLAIFIQTSCTNRQESFALSLVDETGRPQEVLLNLLNVMKIEHLGNLNSIIEETQKAWLRKPGQERWDIDPNQFKALEESARPFLEQLKIQDEKKPKNQDCKGILLLGATSKTQKKRYDFMNALDINASKYYYLVGERDLDPSVESPENLKKIFGEIDIADLRTETNVIQKIINVFPNSKENIVASAPKKLNASGQFVRPTTIDTLNTWLEKNPEPGKYLVVSSAPHIRYQNAVCQRFLAEKNLEDKFTFETIGYGSKTYNLPLFLDALARELYETRLRLQKKGILS